jgi:uncharacterized membrane protein YgaE (UPF0421/DUF939 family)
MIKFFRKIRQRLLSENKFSKYLIYAIGEIVLVVIGILIALSINNWNQQRLLEKQSQQVLINLREEIKEGKTELEAAKEYLQKRLDKRLEYLNNGNQNLVDSIKLKKMSNLVFFYTESIEVPIIENELGPNKKIFQWPELTKSMQNLSKSIEFYNKGIEYLENDVQSNQLPFLVKQGVIIDLMMSSGMLKPQGYSNANVYSSEDFRNVIASNTLMTSALLEVANKVLDDYNQLLFIINKKDE